MLPADRQLRRAGLCHRGAERWSVQRLKGGTSEPPGSGPPPLLLPAHTPPSPSLPTRVSLHCWAVGSETSAPVRFPSSPRARTLRRSAKAPAGPRNSPAWQTRGALGSWLQGLETLFLPVYSTAPGQRALAWTCQQTVTRRSTLSSVACDPHGQPPLADHCPGLSSLGSSFLCVPRWACGQGPWPWPSAPAGLDAPAA